MSGELRLTTALCCPLTFLLHNQTAGKGRERERAVQRPNARCTLAVVSKNPGCDPDPRCVHRGQRLRVRDDVGMFTTGIAVNPKVNPVNLVNPNQTQAAREGMRLPSSNI